jgi:hypothetical protein
MMNDRQRADLTERERYEWAFHAMYPNHCSDCGWLYEMCKCLATNEKTEDEDIDECLHPTQRPTRRH